MNSSFIEELRSKSRTYKILLYVILAVLVLLNTIIGPYDPHVAWEVYPGFWGAFGFILAVAMAFVMKCIIAPIIGAPEDIHD